ncbi:MAG TPA: ArsA-related P-loop ATPase, partial [Polyangiaceae bacterium]|nr:ArsA-related P-loop ATPase [Polyangiaceae bacterium]
MNPIPAILRRRRVLVCAGPGGVGKTTTAAALAVLGARSGRKVAALTVDPARRLADSLGIRDP